MSRYRSEVGSAASLDRPTVARLTAISNATQALDAPAAVPFQEDSLRLELLHGWDDRPVDVLALALDGEEAVGWGAARFANDAIGCRPIHHGIVWQTYTERR